VCRMLASGAFAAGVRLLQRGEEKRNRATAYQRDQGRAKRGESDSFNFSMASTWHPAWAWLVPPHLGALHRSRSRDEDLAQICMNPRAHVVDLRPGSWRGDSPPARIRPTAGPRRPVSGRPSASSTLACSPGSLLIACTAGPARPPRSVRRWPRLYHVHAHSAAP